MGIKIVRGPAEAEAICARLVRMKLATGVVSNDGDSLAHLANIMIIDVKANYRHGRPNHKCTVVVLQNVLATLDLSKQAFVEFCMLLGTDYNTRIKGFGWAFALRELKQHGYLEAAVDSIAAKKEKKKREVLAKGKEWTEPDMEDYRLTKPEMRNAIRAYFMDDIEVPIEENLILFYDVGEDGAGSLRECFQAIFTSFNRSRMLDKVQNVEQQLIEFNYRFSKLQKFVVDHKYVKYHSTISTI